MGHISSERRLETYPICPPMSIHSLLHALWVVTSHRLKNVAELAAIFFNR